MTNEFRKPKTSLACAWLLNIMKTKASVISRCSITCFICIQMNPDGKRSDKAVDGAMHLRRGMVSN